MSWDYWRLLIVLSVSGFVGLLFDQMLLFMLLSMLLYNFWLQHTWRSLLLWLQEPKKNSPPQADGIIDKVYGYIESVNKKNRAQKKKLGTYFNRFQSIMDSLPDAIVIIGEQGKVEWANKSARSLLGICWPKDSHIRVNNLIRNPEFGRLLRASMNEDSAVVAPSPCDPDIQLELKIAPYMGKERLLIARNISKTVKLQRMRRDFVANVSHELRTPLTVLHGYLQAFSDKSSKDDWHAILPVMRQQTERMNNLLKDLLVLSQLETGEKKSHLQSINVAELVTSVIEDAKRLSQYQQHEIKIELKSEKGLLADEGELRSVISNLIFNAVKYVPPKCKIFVRWYETKKGAFIDVEDEGEGIADYHLDRLTERFYRVDSGRSRETGGTGLGLAIVKHSLQRQNAELKIQSTEGKGSCFQCCFPKESIISLYP